MIEWCCPTCPDGKDHTPVLASTDLDTRTGEYKVYFDCKVCKAEGVRHERVVAYSKA